MSQPESPSHQSPTTAYDIIAMVERHVSDRPSFTTDSQIASWHMQLTSFVMGNSRGERRATALNTQAAQKWRAMADDHQSRPLPDLPYDRRERGRTVALSREALLVTSQAMDNGGVVIHRRSGWVSLWRTQRRLLKEWK